ncbi:MULTISPECIES: DUF4145 domain-containing protein [Pseudomonas]|uniref:DUF4145 domain-containing protein n=1 Tax=Pseudomonas TaxID=286 RepID=UPI000C88EBB4|nr:MULTISPECIES: DUF4145 domain-containing protein [Pseudomonas]PMY44568.1 DUF4145 domain-containing protein [Pseudomonas sp. FW306-2-2C-D06C]PYC36766.1 DUF4145 domain-containing protein [Pseudomonas chlororaphis]
MTALLKQRFLELEQQLTEVENSTITVRDPFTDDSETTIPSELILNWRVKARALIERACGERSSHLTMYLEAEKLVSYDSYMNQLKRMKAVFLAAKEDFEGGYLNSLRNLVQAEVFTSELEQADELLRSGYATAAAVIAGVVLETTLRDLCTAHELEHGSLNKMNDDLAKAGAYNASQKKRITALAAIRNDAAHGKPEEFTAADVRGMIEDVERFLATTLQ